MKLKYTILTVSLAAFAVGFSDAQASIFFYMGRPVGAILFGLFLIVQVLEKEIALADQQLKAEGAPGGASGANRNFEEELTSPALTTAHSH